MFLRFFELNKLFWGVQMHFRSFFCCINFLPKMINKFWKLNTGKCLQQQDPPSFFKNMEMFFSLLTRVWIVVCF